MIVDASVFAAFLQPTDVNYLRALKWFESLDEDTVLYAPTIVLPEVASGLRRGRATPQDVLAALGVTEDEQQITLRPVTRALAQRAAELVAELGLHGCDAVYVALAEQRGEPLISFDRLSSYRFDAIALFWIDRGSGAHYSCPVQHNPGSCRGRHQMGWGFSAEGTAVDNVIRGSGKA